MPIVAHHLSRSGQGKGKGRRDTRSQPSSAESIGIRTSYHVCQNLLSCTFLLPEGTSSAANWLCVSDCTLIPFCVVCPCIIAGRDTCTRAVHCRNAARRRQWALVFAWRPPPSTDSADCLLADRCPSDRGDGPERTGVRYTGHGFASPSS